MIYFSYQGWPFRELKGSELEPLGFSKDLSKLYLYEDVYIEYWASYQWKMQFASHHFGESSPC